MSAPALRIGCYRYDTTQALFEGTVGFDGLDATMSTAATIPDIFAGMVKGRAYDVAELGLTYYSRLLDRDDPPFVAIPAFPNRVFRHSCIFVNRHSGISGPADLVGRTIGEFGMYGQDSGVWAKGILADEYGFEPARNRWIIGGLNAPMPPFDFVEQIRPAGVDIQDASPDKDLATMLENGEIDALFTANVPQRVLDGSPDIVRLFPDYETVERDHYRRTGIFPIMHTIVMPRELLAEHPGLARTVYDGFLAAKDVAMERYRTDQRIFEVSTMLPWTNALVERNRPLFPHDWWPYGMAANRSTIDTYLRYQFEQGLTSRRLTSEDLFAPETLAT